MSENPTPETAPQTPEAAPEPKPKKGKKAKVEAPETAPSGEKRFLILDTGKDYKLLILPKDEGDARYDARLDLDVPEEFIDSIAEKGVLEPILVSEGPDGTFLIDAGRTRVRAIPEANKRRKKNGLPPVQLPMIVDNVDEDESMERATAENTRLESPPTVKAKTMYRLLTVGKEEEKVCKMFGVSSQTLHTYLALLDLPKKIQKMVDDGTLSRTAAASLVKLDEGKVEAAAERMAAAAEVGKVTAKMAASAAGTDTGPDRPNAKRIKGCIEDVKALDLGGKHGAAVVAAFCLALEMCLDGRKMNSIKSKLEAISSK